MSVWELIHGFISESNRELLLKAKVDDMRILMSCTDQFPCDIYINFSFTHRSSEDWLAQDSLVQETIETYQQEKTKELGWYQI